MLLKKWLSDGFLQQFNINLTITITKKTKKNRMSSPDFFLKLYLQVSISVLQNRNFYVLFLFLHFSLVLKIVFEWLVDTEAKFKSMYSSRKYRDPLTDRDSFAWWQKFSNKKKVTYRIVRSIFFPKLEIWIFLNPPTFNIRFIWTPVTALKCSFMELRLIYRIFGIFFLLVEE